MAIQTATNPQTGETVALVNGQWVAVGQTATNDKGQKAYLVNNQWLTDQPAEPVKEAGFNLGDIAKSFGMGAVGSTKALTDVAGADNVVSSKLGDVSKSIQQSLSPERQAEMERQAARMKAAEESGSFLQEVKAGALNVAEAPLQSAAQAIGSFVPYLPALFAAPAAAAMRLSAGSQAAVRAVAQQAPKVIGTAQGAGAVKGAIYDGVYQAEIEAGVDPELAKQKEQAAIQLSKDTPTFSILDPVKVPKEKTGPKKSLYVLGTFFIGLIGGAGWAFARKPIQDFLNGLKETPQN
jgi:hypothetical protein